jgi:HD-like signal output (HDOD) protein
VNYFERCGTDCEFLAELDGVTVPAMQPELLALQDECSQPCLDLRRLSGILKEDLGLAIHFFRMAGLQFIALPSQPFNLDEWIVEMGRERMRALAFSVPAMGVSETGLAELWAESRLVAATAEQIAGHQRKVDRSQAYFAGLLSGIGKLPNAMNAPRRRHLSLTAAELILRWELPTFLLNGTCSSPGLAAPGEEELGRVVCSARTHVVGSGLSLEISNFN